MDSKRDKKDAGEPDRRSREYDKRLVEICVEEVLKVLERQKER